MRSEVEPQALVDEALDHAHRDLRAVGNLPRQGVGDLPQLRVRHHALHDTEPMGFGRLDEIGGPQELERLRGADEARQEVRVAVARHQAHAHVARGEAGRLCGHAHVAHHAHAHAGADREPVDHRDDRFVHRFQRLRHSVNALPEAVLPLQRARLTLPHASHVAARAEGAPGARHDDHVHVVVGLGLAERLGPRVDHRARERVELVGPIQRQRRDLVLGLVEQITHTLVLR